MNPKIEQIIEQIKAKVNQIIIKIKEMSPEKQLACGAIALGILLILLAVLLW